MIASFARHGLSQEQLVTEALLQIAVGAETTASSIRGTMLHLMTNAVATRKLQAEIDEAMNSGKVSRPVIKETEAQQLPYLQAVIREGMRMHPARASPITKVVPRGGDTLDIDGRKVFLPGGTNIGACYFSMLRRKDIFDDDADVFRPERWLENEGEKLERMKKTVDLVFGYGQWQCLGKGIAMMELSKVFFELLRNFDFMLVNPAKPWKNRMWLGL